MNGFTAWLQQAVGWLHAKASALAGAFSAVAGNKPEPARQVVFITLVTAVLLVLVPRIVKKLSKLPPGSIRDRPAKENTKMTLATAPSPAPVNCSTASGWTQKWNCGWQQPTTGAAHAGTFAGHNIVPWLIGALIGLVIIALIRKGRSGSPATAS